MVAVTSSHLAGADLRDEGLGHEERTLAVLRPVPRISVQAFCESEEVRAAIEQAGQDRRMAKAHVRVQQGGIRAALEHYAGAPTPNLMILESRLEATALLAELETLSEVCDPGSKVIIVGHHNDIFLYRELTRRGISEYLVAPVLLSDIISIISQIFVAPDAEPLGRTLAFVGAKGGVGSSTIAHNVAWSIARQLSSEVLLADLDLPFGTANINLDQDPAQGIAEALFSADRMDDALLDRLLAKCAERLSLLAAPSILDRTYDFQSDAFATLIEAAQRSTPFVVLDVPHGWNDWTRSVLTQADEIVITASCDLANLRNAKNLVDTLRKSRPNDRPPRLILNQIGVPKRPEIAPDEFLDPLGLSALATIGFEPQLFGTAANNGRMLSETDAKHPVNETVSGIARALTGRGNEKRAKRTGRASLLDLIRRK
ncbi:AAA family ATPase [Aureimonas mangrovi]|uniref:AAA family ATPase n=1 Tax=Aureimonas mangrovi TaxID=2758041 RepID=UPI00163DC97C|nr:CpaE family protein [Aureimonas mangrovi]